VRALFIALLTVLMWVPASARAGTVAVLYFENQGNPGLESLKVGLAQMMVTDIKAGGDVDVIERARLQEIMDELELGHNGVVNEATAAKVGKLLGAQYLVMGSYFELMGTLRIDARVVEVETGRIVHAYGSNDATAKFLSIEKDVATSLHTNLAELAKSPTRSSTGTRSADPKVADATTGTSTPQPAAEPTATTVVAPDPEAVDAAVAFSEGLIHLDQKDLPRAREAFERAVAADPQLDAAKAELARMSL
jgi:TolB-like protein